MTRGHRLVHRYLWPALALVVAGFFVTALVTRPPPEPPAQEQPAKEQKP